MRALVVLLAIVAFAACTPTDACQTNDTRCNDSLLEVCGVDHTWYFQDNCITHAGSDDADYSCQSYTRESGDAGDLGHACLPVPSDGDAP